MSYALCERWLAIFFLCWLAFPDRISAQELRAPSATVKDRPWEDEVVYVVILQKFRNGDPANDIMARKYRERRHELEGGFWGGDLQGLLLELDSLAELGVTALLLYPVIQNDQQAISKYLPTGYRPKDYFQVDENLGDMKLLRKVVDRAHELGLKVLLDMPLAMPGFEHPFQTPADRQDWFGAPTEYGVRRWRVEHPPVADHLIEIGQFWKRETGCDGFRLDSVQLLPLEFWTRFNEELGAGPDFVSWAELVRPPREIGAQLGPHGFQTGYDFSAMTLRDVCGAGEKPSKLSFVLQEGAMRYPYPRSLVAQIDNYEMSQLAALAIAPQRERIALGLTAWLLLDRVPVLYPGTETGAVIVDPDELWRLTPEQQRTRELTQQLLRLRRANPALRRGTFQELLRSDTSYGYVRSSGDQSVAVLLNLSEEEQELTWDVTLTGGAGRRWRRALTDDAEEFPAASVRVRPWSSAILTSVP